MRLFEITRRNFLGGIAGAVALQITKAHSQPALITKNFNLYDDKTRQLVARIVAQLYNVKFNESVPLPAVVPFESIDRKIYLETWGWVPQTNVASHYHWKRNIIILSKNSKVDTLAHEFVHYYQFHPSYKNLSEYVPQDRDGFFEYEANQIQKAFVDYINKRILTV